MPGLLKIGCTRTPPTKRLGELRSTGVPTPFVLEACFRVSDFISVEQRIHSLLGSHRIKSDREFFVIGISEALPLVTPVVADFVCTEASTANSNSSEARVLEELEEAILQHISEQGRHNRSYEYEIEQKFSLSHTKATLHLGRLIKRSFIRARRHDPHLVYYEIEHDGIQYLLDYQILNQEDL
ncbi:MAG: GIY-YIG nuclease family protein [Verrucomicrobiales bacterium]|nr:GIY-YIG nuclease family protein [Verrucomicrobiales bacterium]